jgi:predicted AlkP superfamily phosphohydrolase/phosphomutase
LYSAEPGRVFFVSLDGLGQQLLQEDAAGEELRTVRRLKGSGASATGLVTAFPSTTANSHAALWTGAYAGVNGILYNRDPVEPRADHTFLERGNGFRSEGLTAEPIWLTAARQGVSVVAHQVTQAYPFLPQTAGEESMPGAFAMVNGYQSRSFAPWRVLGKSDVKSMPCDAWGRTARFCFEWVTAEVRLFAAVDKAAMRIGTVPGRAAVRVELQPAEVSGPRGRSLARHWSVPLMLRGLPDDAAASLVFRLFEADAERGEFLLVQGPLQETALLSGGKADKAMAARLVKEAGPMAGNGAHALYSSSAFGTPLHAGGDGTAERRYLETVEWVVRQQTAHSNWLFRERRPRLHITYLPFPDETDHTWLGLEKYGHPGYLAFRKWAYAATDRGVEALAALASARDHVVITSDHGMTPVNKFVAVNVALQRAGLQTIDTNGQIDESQSKAVMVNTCVLLNTTDRKGGIVRPEERPEILAAAERALRAVSEITRVYTGDELAAFGLDGPSGADLCFDLAPNHGASDLTKGEVVTNAATPRGVHGFDPTRPDMHAVLIVSGPRAARGRSLGLQKSTTVAPLICDLLGIASPKHSRAPSPLQGERSTESQ